MYKAFFLACVGLAACGCGESGPSPPDDGTGDTIAQDAPPAEPDVGPDVSPDVGTPCWNCEGGLCQANQAASAGCVYGDFRPGDLCEASGANPCICFFASGEDLGFCTLNCTMDSDCTPYGGECADFAPFCVWTCGAASDCPGS